MDPKLASYGVENAVAAVVQLAQTTMRSELGKITLDKTFEERTALNLNIVKSIQLVTLIPTPFSNLRVLSTSSISKFIVL